MTQTAKTDQLKNKLKQGQAGASSPAAVQGGQVDPVKTIASYLKAMSPRIKDALPKHLDVNRLTQITVTTLRMNPALVECSIESLLGAVMQSASLGLEPNLMGSCYFIPFNNKGKKEVQFLIGYRGMIDLARRSGDVKTITSQVVYENDFFEYEFGLDEKLRHIPARSDRGNPIAVYAYAKLSNEGYAFDVMSIEDVEKIRNEHSAGYKGAVKYNNESNSVWVKHFESMAKKTIIKRLIKLLPISIEIQNQIEHDETIRPDMMSDPQKVDIIDMTEYEEQPEQQQEQVI